MKPQKRSNSNKSNKVVKVLLYNICLGSLILLSFKHLLAGILAFIIMPFYCKSYLDDDLIVNLPVIDHFTTIIFVLSALPGIGFTLLLSLIEDFSKNSNN